MSAVAIEYLPLTGFPAVDALLFGTVWKIGAGGSLSYSFPGANSQWDASVYGSVSEPAVGFIALTDDERAAVRAALAAWTAVAGIPLSEVADDAGGEGILRFAYTTYGMDGGQIAYAYAPNDSANGGDVWLNARQRSGIFGDLVSGSIGYFALLHEIGHALGLKHPYEASLFNAATLDGSADSFFNTVMSYSVWPGILLNYTDGAANIDRLPSTPMAIDIDALQALYGANLNHNSGDDLYFYDAAGKYLETIFDTGGSDTIQVAGSRDAEIDLRPDQWSRLGLPVQIEGGAMQSADTVRIHRSTLIENAIGGEGNDVLIGNDQANRLEGRHGNDTLIGGAGNDALDGGAGSDTAVYSGNRGGYSVSAIDNGYGVIDNVDTDGTDALANIELLQFDDYTVDLTVQAKAASIPPDVLDALIELYVAFFGRVPDGSGMAYWIDRYTGGMTLDQVAQSFYEAGVQFGSVTGYSASMNNAGFVGLVYANALGRTGDAAPGEDEIAYWKCLLDEGALTRGALVAGMLSDVRLFTNDSTWGWVPALIDNKVEVGKTFAIAQGLGCVDPNQAIIQGMAIAAAVTPTDTSAAIALIGINDVPLVS